VRFVSFEFFVVKVVAIVVELGRPSLSAEIKERGQGNNGDADQRKAPNKKLDVRHMGLHCVLLNREFLAAANV